MFQLPTFPDVATERRAAAEGTGNPEKSGDTATSEIRGSGIHSERKEARSVEGEGTSLDSLSL